MTHTGGIPLKVKVVYGGEHMRTDIERDVNFNAFRAQIMEICHFRSQQPFTIKWIDDEGDPCTLSSEIELQEAYRLYHLNKDATLTLHVFASTPEGPGMPCHGETQQMYRKNAKRMRKTFYHLLGHKLEPKRFNRSAVCEYCHDRIWGLGQQGYRCVNCRLLLHRRCRPYVRHRCGEAPASPLIETHGGLPAENALSGQRGAGGHSTGGGVSGPAAVLVLERGDENSANVMPGWNDPSMVPRVIKPMAPLGPQPTPNLSGKEEEPVPGTLGHRPCLEDFRLLKVIGRGSYAKVMQVEHVRTGKVYALKAIKKTLVTDEEDIEWVQTEKHVFEIATNHPFLVGLHSCFQNDSRLFFVIEFVNGGDLMYHMQRKLRLPEDHVRFYSAEICLALNYLHERGILYRDLKLDNVLMDEEGHIKLTDYGMCKEGMSNDHKTTTFCGTPNYIAPEILQGYHYSFSVDWWALGVMMYEMLAGRSPWEGVGQSADPNMNTEDYLFEVILTKAIRIPRSIAVYARQILNGFLQKDPQSRLGCSPNSSFLDIQSHIFFKELDWDKLFHKQIQPPYKPDVRDDYDLRNFDPAFTDQEVTFSPDDPTLIARIDQSEFDGFEYINPLLMTNEQAV